ncbi:hypothetical protein K438DRAFT_1774801 [Mycena galopus ATCC 62051]|nr:hypothetical protein K438DRAFT_1774801 [Mycena galopus ATCC 62051]
MPQQDTATTIRMKNAVACLTPAITLLNELSDVFGTPFLPSISNTALSLITAVQNVKKNQDQCIRLVENVHRLLYCIVDLHLKSETPGHLSPLTLDHVGKFTETLHKIHTFVEAQQGGQKILNFFHQNDMAKLLKDCQAGLQHTIEEFKIDQGFSIFRNISEMQKKADNMHKELLELVSTLSDGTTSDSSCSIYPSDNSSQNSINSFSMLPAKPKIFHGRDSELKEIVELLHEDSARIAILGAGGMGKTSLAKAALHHPHIVAKYHGRFFVTGDSAATSIDLAAIIGSHLGLKPEKDMKKAVVNYFCSSKISLLILDNLETAWEPINSRSMVEEFLSVLTEISHLALIITMRGAERPAKVRWTHPFLPPLKPLSEEAAHQMFIDIAEDYHDNREISQLLSFTDNMPLAVDLIAHLVDSEGCSNVLARWEAERTLMLSFGYDRSSNLDKSITASLTSPRMSSGAIDLLSLLSILPDGLSNVELLQSRLPIKDVLKCKSALLATSSAYNDEKKRLKSLVLIREHMQHFHPVSQPLVHQLFKHFHKLLDFYCNYQGSQNIEEIFVEITSNLENLSQILFFELHPETPDLASNIHCILELNTFTRAAGHGRHALMDHIPVALSQIHNTRLEVLYIDQVLKSARFNPVHNHEHLITQALSLIGHLNDPVLEAELCRNIGMYYRANHGNISAAMEFLDKALTLSRSCGNERQQSIALFYIADVRCFIGDYLAALRDAHETYRLAQLSGNIMVQAGALDTASCCHRALGDYKTSISLNQRASNLFKLGGMSGSLILNTLRHNEAQTYLLKSEYAEARSILTHIVENTSLAGDGGGYIYGLLNLVEIDIMSGVSTQIVQDNMDKAKVALDAIGGPHELRCYEYCSAIIQLREGMTCSAKTIFEQIFNSTWNNHIGCALESLERLGDVGQWTVGDFGWASRWTVVYLGYAKKSQNKLAVHKSLQFLGDVFLTQGDEDTAYSLFTVASDGFTFMDVHRSRAQCFLRLGNITRQRGDLMKAVEFWKEARPLFERSLQGKEIIQIDMRLGAAEQEMLDMQDKKLVQLRDLAASTMELKIEKPYDKAMCEEKIGVSLEAI